MSMWMARALAAVLAGSGLTGLGLAGVVGAGVADGGLAGGEIRPIQLTFDVNRDGVSEELVLPEDPGVGPMGRSVVVRDGATGAELSQFELGKREGAFGWAAAVVPDFDGDGAPDLLISAPLERPSAARQMGMVFLARWDGRPLWQFFNENEGETQFGVAVSAIADVTGDRSADWLVRSRWHAEDGSLRERDHVYDGKSAKPVDGPWQKATREIFWPDMDAWLERHGRPEAERMMARAVVGCRDGTETDATLQAGLFAALLTQTGPLHKDQRGLRMPPGLVRSAGEFQDHPYMNNSVIVTLGDGPGRLPETFFHAERRTPWWSTEVPAWIEGCGVKLPAGTIHACLVDGGLTVPIRLPELGEGLYRSVNASGAGRVEHDKGNPDLVRVMIEREGLARVVFEVWRPDHSNPGNPCKHRTELRIHAHALAR